MSTNRLASHPIGVAAERTGLTPEVLRVWERRYRAVEPTRSEGGQRLYSDADIERLRLMSLATAAGRSISLVAPLSTDELTRLVADDAEARRRLAASAGSRGIRLPPVAADDVADARTWARVLDASALERVLRRSAALLGIDVFLETVATPLLQHLDDDAKAEDLPPAAAQLAAVTLRRVVEGIMPALVVASNAPNLLVATPAAERHEIDAVMAAATAAAEGWRVTYLGPSVPAGEIATAALSTAARAVGVTVPRVLDRDLLIQELRALRGRLTARIPLLVGGAGAPALASEIRGAGVQVIENLADLRRALRIADPIDSAR